MLQLIILSICFHFIACDNPVIQTNSGPIQGFTLKTDTGKELDAYYGIPYAKPPIGERRFQKSEPVEPWTEVFEANKAHRSCYQHSMIGMLDPSERNEDCLLLYITVPRTSEKKNLPVIVRLHGGGFIGCSATSIIGNTTTLSAEENVIIASMNYRLGALGFLYLGNKGAPGNAGLWDQNLALKWIKENIESFGGDPDSITLIGESAGGASVQYHAISEHSHPYFNRAIMESGMASNPWAIQENKLALQSGLEVAKILGCSKTDHEEVVTCLQSIDAAKLMKNSEKVKLDELMDFVFVPVVDGDFITDHPKVLVEKGKFKKGEYMVGSADEEGVMFAQMFLADGKMMTIPKIHKHDITRFCDYLAPDGDKMIRNVIVHLYTNWTNPDLEANHWETADKIFGDYYFTCGVNDFSDAAAQHGSTVFRHVFAEQVPGFMSMGASRAYHAAQCRFIYGMAFNKNNPMYPYNPSYEEPSRRLMRARANFARTGDPNKSPDGSEPEVNWPQYTLDNKEYLLVKAKEDSVGYGYRDNYCAFWRELMPKLQQERESCSA